MSNDDAQAIFLVIFLLALLAVVFVPLILFLAYTYFLKRKRDSTREAILREHQQLIGSHPWFPVRYASEPRFKSFLKIFPWEGAGILVILPGSVLFFGETSSGQVSLQFAPANSTINWLGKAPWPNGAVSWFYFETTPGKQYFSSETGVLIFGSHKSTKAIYDNASQNFLPASAP
jgi:hypothetical protein